jgi:hypothetical protein
MPPSAGRATMPLKGRRRGAGPRSPSALAPAFPQGSEISFCEKGRHTGGMGRMVTARVTYGGMSAGSVGPFPVDNPWWAEVEPVVAHLEATLGVPVVVLRLLTVEGADGARDGHVTYHVEALRPPRNLTGCVVQDEDHPLRMPWARASGITELLRWASRYVDVVGRPAQRKTWNLAGLFRLPTVDGPVWLKALPPVRRGRTDRDRRGRRRRSEPGADRAGQCAGTPAAGRHSRQGWLGRVPGDRGGRRAAPVRRSGADRPTGDMAFRTGARRLWLSPSATCSTAHWAPNSAAPNCMPRDGCRCGGRCWRTAACRTRSCTVTSTPATGAAVTARRSSSTSPTHTSATRTRRAPRHRLPAGRSPPRRG